METALLALGATVVIAMLLATIALIAYSKKNVKGKTRKDPTLSMLATFISDALTSRALDEEIKKLAALDQSGKAAFMMRNFDSAPRGDQKEIDLTHVLYGKTRVNMNAMNGYYEHKVLAGKAPSVEEVVTFVRVCRNYMVGTVALVGDFGRKDITDKNKIYPFVLMREQDEMVTADGKGKLAKFEATKILIENGVTWAKTTVSLANETCCTCPCGENRPFQMDIIHIPGVLDPKNQNLAISLATGIDRMAQEQLENMKRGKPTVAILCANGIDLSTLTTSAYFTYQGYEDTEKATGNGKVNVIGIARHVSEHRPGAFAQKQIGLDKTPLVNFGCSSPLSGSWSICRSATKACNKREAGWSCRRTEG